MSATYKFTRHAPAISIYSRFRVKNSMRAQKSPRVAKAWRTRKLMNLTAFFRNRFYEIDRWYKARIDRPVVYPTCYTIEPENFSQSLEERLANMRVESEEIDIGAAFDARERSEVKERATNPDHAELERLARLRKLHLDPRQIDADSLTEHVRVKLLKKIGEHSGIFRDLFHEDAFFHPVTDLKVAYSVSSDPTAGTALPVYHGNDLSPNETKCLPNVTYKADENSFYTLLMVNPDGCIYDENCDVLHWLVCNIPGNDLKNADTVCEYMQPLPLHGTGWHRMVFLLFKQERKSAELIKCLSTNKDSSVANQFEKRTFRMSDFYLKHEDLITPVGFAFFQSSWDKSCTDYFHNVLGIEQPIYAFEWPEPHFEPQEEYPEEYQSFNHYLDKYRDYKDVDKEILLKRLKNRSPFKADEPKLRFPNLLMDEDRLLPTWMRVEKVQEREGYGKYRGIYENPLK